MFQPRHPWLALAGCLAALVGASPAGAGHEPNNSPGNPFPLPLGQLIVSDDLDGNAGRPDTVLGFFDPTYQNLLGFNDDATNVGNGKGSQMLGVPVQPNGSAHFQVTGAPDTSFLNLHTQNGRYRVHFDVRNANGDIVRTYEEPETVEPGMIDSVWLPDEPGDWTGHTVDVTVNNVIGKGTGDSLDFFEFNTGLPQGAAYTAMIINAEFDALLARYNGITRVPGETSAPGNPVISGLVGAGGFIKIGVTGIGDDGFIGQHFQTGEYTLVIVPEPTSGALLIVGAAIAGYAVVRRRRARQ
jgi:hypothetical protein